MQGVANDGGLFFPNKINKLERSIITNIDDISSLIISANIEYQDIIITNIKMMGQLINNSIVIDSALMQIEEEIIKFSANFDLKDLNWNASITS